MLFFVASEEVTRFVVFPDKKRIDQIAMLLRAEGGQIAFHFPSADRPNEMFSLFVTRPKTVLHRGGEGCYTRLKKGRSESHVLTPRYRLIPAAEVFSAAAPVDGCIFNGDLAAIQKLDSGNQQLRYIAS